MAWQMAADHGIGLRHVVRGQVTSPKTNLSSKQCSMHTFSVMLATDLLDGLLQVMRRYRRTPAGGLSPETGA